MKNKKAQGLNIIFLIICIIVIGFILFLIILTYRNPTRILQNKYCWETYKGKYDYYRGNYFCIYLNDFGIQRMPFNEEGFEVWKVLNEK